MFRDLGFVAETDVRVQGARNHHDIDVLATYQHAGLELLWVIECKYWKRRVGKDRVLTLRSVVEDVGADKGVLLAEQGFQSGATQATFKSNVVLSRLDDLRAEAAESLVQRRLLEITTRVGATHGRYWALPKAYRQEVGLRPDVGVYGYSGARILSTIPDLVISALGNDLPPRTGFGVPLPVYSKGQAANVAEFLLDDLEMRLAAAERVHPKAALLETFETGAAARQDSPPATWRSSLSVALGMLLDRAPEEIPPL